MMQVIGRQAINIGSYGSQQPLIRLIDFAKERYPVNYKIQPDLYCIYISPEEGGEGKLLFIAAGQTTDIPFKNLPYHPMAQALVFHPDLLQGTMLATVLMDYIVFNQSTNTTLPLSQHEYQLARDFFDNVHVELTQTLDRHSKRLLVSNIELFLNYCERFFSRNLILADHHHKGILRRFDQMLSRYFSSENPFKFGIPSVAYCAGELHLSAKYFGSLVKKETGKTAQQYIRDKILSEAKNRLNNMDKTINEISFELGFKYPQHFSRYFKKVIGQTPHAYKQDTLVSYHSSNY
jgi:AraC family transcriptional regulator, transcriptional activator of pobA